MARTASRPASLAAAACLCLLLAMATAPASVAAARSLRVTVNNQNKPPGVPEAWMRPTVAYLNRTVGPQFNVSFRLETLTNRQATIDTFATGETDLHVGNVIDTACAMLETYSPIVTQQHRRNGVVTTRAAGVAISLANNTRVQEYDDLRSASVGLAVGVPGWASLYWWYEARLNGVEVFAEALPLSVVYTYDALFDGLVQGLVDVIVADAGSFSELIAERNRSIDEFRLILGKAPETAPDGSDVEEFPFLRSSETYGNDAVLASHKLEPEVRKRARHGAQAAGRAGSHVGESVAVAPPSDPIYSPSLSPPLFPFSPTKLVEAIQLALVNMPETDEAFASYRPGSWGWSLPVSYGNVFPMLRDYNAFERREDGINKCRANLDLGTSCTEGSFVRQPSRVPQECLDATCIPGTFLCVCRVCTFGDEVEVSNGRPLIGLGI